jgi:hypothetical protein
MKKLSLYIFLILMVIGNVYADHSLEHIREQMDNKNLLKRNGECQDILESKNKWKFLFSRKDAESYYVDIEGSYPTGIDDGYGSNKFQKNFAGVKSDFKLFWYELNKDEKDDDWNSLIINVLEYLPKESKPENFISIMVFFNADYKKAEYKKLEDLYIKAINEGKINFGTNTHLKYQKDFFNEAHNFLETRLVLGKESWDKGNWTNVLRAECKAFPSEKKLNVKDLRKDVRKKIIKKKTN